MSRIMITLFASHRSLLIGFAEPITSFDRPVFNYNFVQQLDDRVHGFPRSSDIGQSNVLIVVRANNIT